MSKSIIPASWSKEYKIDLYKALKEDYKEVLKKQLGEEYSETLIQIAELEEPARKVLANPEKVSGFKTGYYKFDELARGFDPGDLVVISGRGGTGKTMFALSLMMQAYASRKEPDFKTLIFSLEMTNVHLAARIYQMAQDTKWNEITPTLPIYLYSNKGNATLKKLRKAISDMKQDEGLDLVIIDHLHYFSGDIQNQTNEIGKIVREIKRMAVEFNVPIFLLSQVRKAGPGAFKETTSEDIRDSGMVQADADVVIVLNRNYMDDKEKYKLKVAVEKNRNKGSTGYMMMYIRKSYMLTEAIPGFDYGQR